MTKSLAGQLLVASPQIDDSRFRNAVILVCEHDRSKAMGLIVNRQVDGLDLATMSKHLGIAKPRFHSDAPIYMGGPVESSRGIVLHSTDHVLPESVMIADVAALTAHIRIVTEIAKGQGPSDFIIALGHANWGAQQLEHELKNNVWLTMPYAHDLVFADGDPWHECYARLGIAVPHFSGQIGTA